MAIAKEYELVTEEQVDGKPALEQTGKGEIRFDLQQVTLDGDQLDKALAALGSQSTSQAGAAAMRLARAEPVDERRREVAEALEPLLSLGGVAAVAAVEALGVWGGAEDVPKLIAMLEENMVVRLEAAKIPGAPPRIETKHLDTSFPA